MNLLILTSIILSVILGVGRMVDLALFTDAETGLCVVGSVWLRYAALAVAILLAVAAGSVGQQCGGPDHHGVPEPFLQRMVAGAGPELDEQELEAAC